VVHLRRLHREEEEEVNKPNELSLIDEKKNFEKPDLGFIGNALCGFDRPRPGIF